MQAEDKDGIMATMTHIRDVRKKAPMVTGLFGPLKDTVLLLKSRGIAMDLPPVNKQVGDLFVMMNDCLLYTSPSPRD